MPNHPTDHARPFSGRATRRRVLASLAGSTATAGVLATTARAQEATPTPGEASPAARPPIDQMDQAAFDATFSHHTIVANGVLVHYVIGGQGDPLVLLHGWPQTWYEWRRVMPALAERYTVIAPDLRGLGDSAKPATGYDARTVAADVYDLVRRLGVGPVFLAGHDLGGWVAYAYAAAHRDEVRRLALLEIIPADDPIVGFTILSPEPGLSHFHFHFQRDLPEALVEGRERLYLSAFYRGAYDPTAIDEASIDEYVRCYAAPGGMRAGFEYYRALFTNVEQTKEDMRTPLAMPVLTLGGAASFGPVLEREWPKHATDVRSEILPEAGHWLPEERPDLVRDHLLAFFGEG